MVSALTAYGLALFVFPLEIYGAIGAAQLYWGGARRFVPKAALGAALHDGLEMPHLSKGWIRDHCDPADPEARGCTCVALIHGMGDSPQTWKKLLLAPASTWKRPVKLIALNVERESKYIEGTPTSLYGAQAQAHQIAEVLKPLCPSFIVVGNSMGAWIASWLTIDQEVPVTKLVLADAVGLKEAPNAMAVLRGNFTVDTLKQFEKRAYFKPRVLPDSVWNAAFRKFQKSNINLIDKAQADEDYLDGKLASIKVPTMLIWGDSDRIAPIDGGRAFERQLHSPIWRDHKECGHLPQKECSEDFIADINEMLVYGSM
jgi:pimeloyl-ACP methyl ester carboxylesterase